MKKALLYLLLLSYMTVIGKPAIPALSDAVAHIFWYADHVATVHYENGKYHVHVENVEQARRSNQENTPELLKAGSFFAAHLLCKAVYDFQMPIDKPSHFTEYFNSLLPGSPNNDVPPPRC